MQGMNQNRVESKIAIPVLLGGKASGQSSRQGVSRAVCAHRPQSLGEVQLRGPQQFSAGVGSFTLGLWSHCMHFIRWQRSGAVPGSGFETVKSQRHLPVHGRNRDQSWD